MELKGRRLRSVKRLCSIIVLQLEKARKRITVAVSGGALKITVRAQVAENLSRSLQNKNLYGEKTILSALCNWLVSLMLCVSSFLYGYGHWSYLNRFSALLFWSDGCNWYQTGVFSLLAHSFVKETIVFAPYKFSYTELGVTKKCRWSHFKLGWPASGAVLPEMN